jgi:outer membrane receptor protein involved in Fe transport
LPTLTLNYGLRFDAVNEFTNENQVSPRVNAVWKATETTTVHAGYSRYFVPPPFELVSPTTITLFNNTTAAPLVPQDDIVKRNGRIISISGSARSSFLASPLVSTAITNLQPI